MKILHIINTLNIAGAERLMTSMIPVQRASGHDVELLLLNETRTAFYDQLRDQGIAIHAFRMKGGEYNPFCIWKLRRYLRRYDVVHVHLFPAQYWVAVCKWVFRIKTPAVTTEHSTSNSRFNHVLTTWTDRWVYRRYACIVGITDAVTKVMDDRVRHCIPVVTIENGIDIHAFSSARPLTKQALGLPDDCKVLLQVARFRPPKNQACVIKAVALLPSYVHAVFAGEGEGMDDCKKLAMQLHVADRVHFLGIRNDIAALCATSDVGVVSSHWEGFGLAAVESMAAGKPVVVSAVDGLQQIVSNEGLTFADDDEHQLAARLQRLLTDHDYYQSMASFCQERAQHYSIERMAAAYVELYKKVLAGQ